MPMHATLSLYMLKYVYQYFVIYAINFLKSNMSFALLVSLPSLLLYTDLKFHRAEFFKNFL